MEHVRNLLGIVLLVAGFSVMAQQPGKSQERTGRFLDGSGTRLLVAQSLEPQNWNGEDYFKADLLLLNVKNGKEVKVNGRPSYYWNALFTDDRHFIFTEGNHVYRRHVRAGAKPQCVYTLRDTQQMQLIDMVRYEKEVYLVLADYTVKKLENARWPSDDDSYSSLMRIVELETGTEIARFSFPYTQSPRYVCLEKREGWSFSVMDTTFVMDVPRHLQPAYMTKEKKNGNQFENSWFKVSPVADQPKIIRITSR